VMVTSEQEHAQLPKTTPLAALDERGKRSFRWRGYLLLL
jgi:hypothetical protein